MMLKNVMIDTDTMSCEEIASLINDLREVRVRKTNLRKYLEHFRAMLSNMRDVEGMTLINKHTGEVLNPDDWKLYDEIGHTFYHEESGES